MVLPWSHAGSTASTRSTTPNIAAGQRDHDHRLFDRQPHTPERGKVRGRWRSNTSAGARSAIQARQSTITVDLSVAGGLFGFGIALASLGRRPGHRLVLRCWNHQRAQRRRLSTSPPAVLNGGGSNDVAAALEYDWHNSARLTFTLSGGTRRYRQRRWPGCSRSVIRGSTPPRRSQLGALSKRLDRSGLGDADYAGAMIAFAAGAPTSTAFTDPGGRSNFRAVALFETITLLGRRRDLHRLDFWGRRSARFRWRPCQQASRTGRHHSGPSGFRGGDVTLAAASCRATGTVTAGGTLAATLADAAIQCRRYRADRGVGCNARRRGRERRGARCRSLARFADAGVATLAASAHVVGNSLNVTLAARS